MHFLLLLRTILTVPHFSIFIISLLSYQSLLYFHTYTSHFPVHYVFSVISSSFTYQHPNPPPQTHTPGLPWRTFQRLGELQRALDMTLPQMITMVEDTFEVRPYSKRQVCELLNTTSDELNQVDVLSMCIGVRARGNRPKDQLEKKKSITGLFVSH